MDMSSRIGRWLGAVLTCLAILVGSGAYLLYSERVAEDEEINPNYVINQVRLHVSEIMLYLEQNNAAIAWDHTVQAPLLAMSKQSGIDVLFAQLDGKVVFQSSSNQQEARETLNVKTEVHYDLYASRTEQDVYKIAFPVVDEATNRQVGNAIFTLSESIVFQGKDDKQAIFPYSFIVISLVLLATLLFSLWKKSKTQVLQPIHQLREHSTAILKGNYDQKVEYGRLDEIGELYATFDQMRLEIKELHHRREQQDQAQKELISNISHDIKTPLTTIKAYIEAIRSGLCPDLPTVLEYMEVMQAHADKMTRLVEDLLLHALRELGQISVHPTEQYSQELFEDILKPIGHYVHSTGIDYLGPQEIPNVLIKVDAVRLEQVMTNLAANALKHTTAGDSIRVSIEQEQDQLKVTFADTGAGILPQDMAFIFERYFKGQASSRHKKIDEGSGLGLSICKYIIEAHQGTISFKSTPGRGTVFYFTIPLA